MGTNPNNPWYLVQLSRWPNELEHTGIYDLFPKEVTSFLEKLGAPGKKDFLNVLTKLSQEANFFKAVTAHNVLVSVLLDLLIVILVVNANGSFLYLKQILKSKYILLNTMITII